MIIQIQYPLYDDYSMKREDKLEKLSIPVTLRNNLIERKEKRSTLTGATMIF